MESWVWMVIFTATVVIIVAALFFIYIVEDEEDTSRQDGEGSLVNVSFPDYFWQSDSFGLTWAAKQAIRRVTMGLQRAAS